MSRIIQRLIAFAIISSILLTGCGARPVTIKGLHAVAVEEGRPTTLNFKLRNPTPYDIVLTGIELQTLERDSDRNGTLDPFIYTYRPEIHHYLPTEQGLVDEIVLEVRLSAGQIVDFSPEGEYYVRLVYSPPTDPPLIAPQKGLQHGYLMAVKFAYSVITLDPADSAKEIRTPQDFPVQEAFID